MEFTKVSSFVDLDATATERDAFIKQIEEIIAKVKSVGLIELKLSGTNSTKDAAKAMTELAKEQTKLSQVTKQYEKSILDAAKAEKIAASAAKDMAAAKKLAAQASNEASKSNLNEAKSATELGKQQILNAKYQRELAKEKERLDRVTKNEIKNLEKSTNAYEQLKYKYNLAANSAKQLGAAEGVNSENFKRSAAAAQLYYQQLIELETAVGQQQRQVGQYQNATFALNQVLRESPAFINSVQTGFLAISNNLPILSDEFTKLVKITGSSRKAFLVLFRSLFTFQTALVIGITLLTAYGKEIGQFFSRIFKGEAVFSKTAESAKLLNKAFADTSVKDAIKNVQELTINIDLARKGFISKEKVLKQYNESIGETIGKANSLNEAEALLVKNGDAYVKVTLYKAAANAALEEAASKALEAEKLRNKLFSQAPTTLQTLKAPVDPLTALDDPTRGRESLIDKLNKKNQAAAAKVENQANQLIDIAKNFQQRAANLAADLGLDFFGKDFEDNDKAQKAEDFLKDLLKQQQERLKLSNEITRTRLEGEAAALLSSAQKERTILQQKGESYDNFRNRQAAALADQLDDYQAYYNKILELTQFNTKAELAELEAKTREEKRLVQEKLDAKDSKLNPKQRKQLQDTLLAIDAKAEEEKQLIVLKGNEALLAFDRQYEAEVTGATKKGLDDRLKARLEYFEKLKDQLKKELNFQNDSLTVLASNEIAALNKKLRDQEISIAQYNRERLKLAKRVAAEELDNQILYYQELLLKTAETEEERRDIEAKIAELRLKKDQEITDAKIKNLEKVNEAAKRLGNEALSTFEAVVVGRYEKEKNAIQDQIDLLEEKKARDIDVANQTAANAAEAADRVAVINARALAERNQLERRQRQIDQERAKFERTVEVGRIIGQTAVGVINALSGPPPAPPNPVLAGIIAATGALQLARVLATPIPRYAEGLDNAVSDHLAIVGDGGRKEYVRYPDGSGWITPDKPTLAWIPKGASVSKSLDEAASIYRHLAPGFSQPVTDNGIEVFAGVVKSEMAKTRKAIANKKENYFTVSNGKISMITKDGYNETQYLNQNLSF